MTPERPGGAFLDVPNGRLYYEVTGSGPALTLIHAGVADLTMWDEQVRVFAERYTVIRYDTRGFGRTTLEDAPFSNRQDIRDLLDHLGVRQTHLLGLSRGGVIALDFTIESPERVTALILAASGLSGFEPTPEMEATPAFQELIAQDAETEKATEAGDWERVVELELRMWVDGPGQPPDRVDPAVREWMRDVGRRNYAVHVTSGQPQPLQPPANERLDEVHVPTLIISAGFDTVYEQAAADRLAAGIPGARRVHFDDVAHMINMERPDDFNRAVLDFLAEVDTQRATAG